MVLDARQRLFILLGAAFLTCLIVGDIIGGKLISFSLFGFPFTTTVGMLPFPVTFLLTDVLNEFYGKRAARFITLVGFVMAMLSFSVIYLAGAIPIAEFTKDPTWQGVTEASFANVFLGSQRMIAASMAAYLVAQFVDIGVFHLLKQVTGGKYLWLRASGSTAVSQMVDTIAITIVAWVGVLPWSQIGHIIISAYGLKILIAVGLTPAIYACHSLVEKRAGITPMPVGAD
jgi:queuosine precursor transporter